MEAVETLMDWLTTAPVADYQLLSAFCVVIFLWLGRCYVIGRSSGRGMWVLLPAMAWVLLLGSQAATPPPGPALTPVHVIGGLWLVWLGWYLVWRIRAEGRLESYQHRTTKAPTSTHAEGG
jgi:threonine/homoserine/homoserine lactone efflux protein